MTKEEWYEKMDRAQSENLILTIEYLIKIKKEVFEEI